MCLVTLAAAALGALGILALNSLSLSAAMVNTALSFLSISAAFSAMTDGLVRREVMVFEGGSWGASGSLALATISWFR
jgi:hypothetical protein